jgi:hypothetical protein
VQISDSTALLFAGCHKGFTNWRIARLGRASNLVDAHETRRDLTNVGSNLNRSKYFGVADGVGRQDKVGVSSVAIAVSVPGIVVTIDSRPTLTSNGATIVCYNQLDASSEDKVFGIEFATLFAIALPSAVGCKSLACLGCINTAAQNK